MFFIMSEQPLLIGGEAEEPAFLDRPVDRRALRRELLAAVGGDQLLLVIIGFVADRIPTLVAAEIEVAARRHCLPDRLARPEMVGLGGADEAVVGNVQGVVHCLERSRHFLGEFLRRHTALARRLRHFQAMFVGAGQEEDVAAPEALEAGDGVGRDRLIGMADMRPPVGIGDGGGDVERVAHRVSA